MSVPGPARKDTSINRNAPRSDWTDVIDRPYRGKRPTLPKTRKYEGMGEGEELPLDSMTLAWWDVISTMPHCRLWTPGDWTFALRTALLVDAFHYGKITAAAEIRACEAVMGVTADARQKQRIRYVPAGTNTPKKPTTSGPSGTVSSIDERRMKQRQSV